MLLLLNMLIIELKWAMSKGQNRHDDDDDANRAEESIGIPEQTVVVRLRFEYRKTDPTWTTGAISSHTRQCRVWPDVN